MTTIKKSTLTGMTLFFLLSLWACANNAEKSNVKQTCDITITVEGAAPGWAKLIGSYTDKTFFVDSFKIENGKLRIKQDSSLHQGLYYVLFPDNQNIQILLSDDQQFDLKTTMSDLIQPMQVTGSIDNDLLYQSFKLQQHQDNQQRTMQVQANGKPENDPAVISFKNMVEDFRAARRVQLAEMTKAHPNSFFVKFKNAGQNPEVKDIRLATGEKDLNTQAYFFRKEYWDKVDFSEERLMYSPVLSNKMQQFFGDVMPQHQDSIVQYADALLSKSLANPEIFKYMSNWLLLKYEPGKTTLMDGEAVFSNIVEKFFTAENAIWLKPGELADIRRRAGEMKASLLNKQAADVTANDINGQPKSIYSIKSPYIIVYLYHTDCEHCQAETPKLVQMYPQLKSRGIEFYTIAVNTTDAEWRKFVKTYHMEQWTNVFDATNVSVYSKYFVDNTPEIYVLNKERKIIGKNLKPEQINQILDMDQKVAN